MKHIAIIRKVSWTTTKNRGHCDKQKEAEYMCRLITRSHSDQSHAAYLEVEPPECPEVSITA
jgi:hypothetical protein